MASATQVRAGSQLPLIAGVSMAALGAVTGFVEDGPILCPFRRCTGGYCPGCGGTRAVHHLARGDVGQAWVSHPWILLAAGQLAVAVGVLAFVPRVVGSHLVRPVLAANLVVLLAIWSVRLSVGLIPAPFQ